MIAPEEELPALEREVASLLYRATRELLFNTRKHSGADEADVKLTLEQGELRLTVSDAGRGSEPARLLGHGGGHNGDAGGTGYGLPLIRKRLDLLGGRVEVDTAPGSGCRFTLRLPTEETVAATATR